jgi:hypothetical protein
MRVPSGQILFWSLLTLSQAWSIATIDQNI